MNISTEHKIAGICSKDPKQYAINNPVALGGKLYATNGRGAVIIPIEMDENDRDGVIPLPLLRSTRRKVEVHLGETTASNSHEVTLPRPDLDVRWPKALGDMLQQAEALETERVIAIDARSLAGIAAALGAKNNVVVLRIPKGLEPIVVRARCGPQDGRGLIHQQCP